MSLLTILNSVWGLACVFALVQSLLLGLHAWEHRRFARRRVRDPRAKDTSQRVALLAPCKGLDLELEENLRHLLVQNYGNYEVLFIVEHEQDPAYEIIQRLASQTAIPVRVVIAGLAHETGQKIQNLIAALDHVSPDVKILAFVDSDICPAPDWLGRLVQRLYRPETGAVTGYRWYVPKQATFANSLLASINAGIAALLGAGKQHLVWGGSWAMRRADFDRIGIRQHWHGTLSDDLVATQVLHAAGLTIHYEPACMTASPCNFQFWGLLSFLRRQHMIGRMYSPGLWYQSLSVQLVSSCALLGAIGIWCTTLATRGQVFWLATGFLCSWYLLQVYRGFIRRGLARVYVPAWTNIMEHCAWFDIACSPLALLVNTTVMLSACFGNRIVWRSISYDLDRQGKLLRITRLNSDVVKSDVVLPVTSATAQHLRVDPAEGLSGMKAMNVPVTAVSHPEVS